ncbi:MAG: hypothetical protein ACOC37_00435 [Spirochaetota bacterium]
MESVRPRLLCIAPLLLLASLARLGAIDGDTVSVDVDWATHELRVTVERRVSAIGAQGPAAISETQRSIRRDATELIVDALADLPFDSYHTVESLVTEQEGLIGGLESAARSARAVEATSSPDLKSARVTFVVDLYADLASRLVDRDRAARIDPILGWVATTEYSGIIVYAADDLPVFGTGTTARLEPALLPGIHYLRTPQELLYRLVESENIEPEVLATRGPAAYTDDIQATGLADRIGSNPLRILAIGSFGRRPSDIVISERDATKILGSPHNASLLAQGRVVIVVDPDRL